MYILSCDLWWLGSVFNCTFWWVCSGWDELE